MQGTGLFTGKPATLVIRPAPPGESGITFARTGEPACSAPAVAESVVPDARHTVLARTGASGSPAFAVHTTEHLLSAMAAMGLWSARIDLDGPEVPIMDGSAEPFVRALLAAGVMTGPGPRPPVYRITTPIVIEAGSARIEALPLEASVSSSSTPAAAAGSACNTPAPPTATAVETGRALWAEYHLDYGESSPIPRQSASVIVAADGAGGDFIARVAPARTFSLLAEALAARAAGLFAHVSPADMLVIGDDGAPIENSWRLSEEPARHKLLDLIGDLALVGGPIVGRVIARRSGHALNHQLARQIRESVTPG